MGSGSIWHWLELRTPSLHLGWLQAYCSCFCSFLKPARNQSRTLKARIHSLTWCRNPRAHVPGAGRHGSALCTSGAPAQAPHADSSNQCAAPNCAGGEHGLVTLISGWIGERRPVRAPDDPIASSRFTSRVSPSRTRQRRGAIEETWLDRTFPSARASWKK